MAKTGQTIANPVTGQRILFLTSAKENGGTRWEVEWFIEPHKGKFPPAHVHPTFSERFEILAGLARYQLAGKESSAKSGETVVIPAAAPHINPWSASDAELHMRHVFEVSPPNLKMLSAAEVFFEQMFGLARAGKVNQDGLPHLFQFVVLAHMAEPAAYQPGIPIGIQKIILGALAGVGHWLGYQARYPQYSENERR